jgi:hypothetical protein
MDFVGNLPFIMLEGPIEPPCKQFENISKDAVDGTALRDQGIKGVQFTLKGIVDCIDAADAANLQNAAIAIQNAGLPVTIGQTNVTYPNIFVLRVGGFQGNQCRNAIGGLQNGTYLATIVWTLIGL